MKPGKRNHRIKIQRNLSAHEKQMRWWVIIVVVGALVVFAVLFYLVNRSLLNLDKR